MAKLISYISIVILGGLIAVAGCKKKPDPSPHEPQASLTIDVQHMAGTSPLQLGTAWYKNANGDSLSIDVFNYFISNIELIKEDGSIFKEPESYHLIIDSHMPSKSFTIENIPKGIYSKISFIIGVDSEKNVSGAQTGALNPSSGMFWDWNTGYVMAKMEGHSPQSDLSEGFFAYHLAGFSEPINSLRTITLELPKVLDMSTSHQINMQADALEWFKTPYTIKIKEMPVFDGTGKDMMQIADNYSDMFRIISAK